jgi:Glycosyl hydrolase family 47
VSFRSDNGRMGDSTAVLSELGTLQVEFRYLSHHLKNLDLEKKAMKPLQIMHSKDPDHGLFPISINIADGSFADTHITLGALGDSFYEYLLKVWIQGGKKETWLREMYDKAVDGVIDILLEASSKTGLAFLSDWTGTANVRKMDHLVCFMPGVMALGAHTDPRGPDSVRAKRDLAVAKALMHTCHEMYTRQSSGIAPEFVEFPERGDMSVTSAPFYILRPETAESLFVLNQITGDPMYRDWAWGIWENINKHCRTDTAYAALRDVNNPALGVDNRMESFFLAETLKYLYLALDPDNTIDLDVYVINTEAHPMRIFDDSHVPVPAS